jgi:hypothetical protein
MNQHSATSDGASGDGEILWGFWYPALRSDLLRGQELVATTRLEVP